MALSVLDQLEIDRKITEEHRRLNALDSELRAARSALARLKVVANSSQRARRPVGVRLHPDIAQPIVEARDRLLALKRESARLMEQKHHVALQVERAGGTHNFVQRVAARTEAGAEDCATKDFMSPATALLKQQQAAYVKKQELDAVESVVKRQLQALLQMSEGAAATAELEMELAALEAQVTAGQVHYEGLCDELVLLRRVAAGKSRIVQNARVTAATDCVMVEGAAPGIAGVPITRAAQLEGDKVRTARKMQLAQSDLDAVHASLRTRALTLQQLTKHLGQLGSALTALTDETDDSRAPVATVRTQALTSLQLRLQELQARRSELSAALDARDSALEEAQVRSDVIDVATRVARKDCTSTLAVHKRRVNQISLVATAQSDAADTLIMSEREKTSRLVQGNMSAPV